MQFACSAAASSESSASHPYDNITFIPVETFAQTEITEFLILLNGVKNAHKVGWHKR